MLPVVGAESSMLVACGNTAPFSSMLLAWGTGNMSLPRAGSNILLSSASESSLTIGESDSKAFCFSLAAGGFLCLEPALEVFVLASFGGDRKRSSSLSAADLQHSVKKSYSESSLLRPESNMKLTSSLLD